MKVITPDDPYSGGFAFVAYPAEYGSSGVMTFIVGVDGVVYQKDLGKKTEVLARGMKEYNPDSSWQTTKEQEGMAAALKGGDRKKRRRSHNHPMPAPGTRHITSRPSTAGSH